MSATVIQLEKKANYAVITINRPDALNALNSTVLNELYETVDQLGKDKSTRAIILTGQGPKSFVAGADVAVMQNMSENEAAEFAHLGHRTMNAISQSELISVAAINGFALGGGLELALACDMRLAADTARLGLPEVTLGLIPGFGGTQRLSRLVGKGIALEMILGAGMINAERAYQIGLVNAVHPAADLLSRTADFVERILDAKSGQAQRAARWVVNYGLDQPLPAALAKEVTTFGELFKGTDPKAGITAFLNKSKAEFES
ncbi:MAG: enoyl-CoA hydratase/isomerase family protein [Leptospiraceae bacterium]|nr:enoyl-CoA hydratase/isomerase family protein [Leptospiraceae bacterium]